MRDDGTGQQSLLDDNQMQVTRINDSVAMARVTHSAFIASNAILEIRENNSFKKTKSFLSTRELTDLLAIALIATQWNRMNDAGIWLAFFYVGLGSFVNISETLSHFIDARAKQEEILGQQGNELYQGRKAIASMLYRLSEILLLLSAYFLRPDYINTHDQNGGLGFGYGVMLIIGGLFVNSFLATKFFEVPAARLLPQREATAVSASTVSFEKTGICNFQNFGILLIIAGAVLGGVDFVKTRNMSSAVIVGIALIGSGLYSINIHDTRKINKYVQRAIGVETARRGVVDQFFRLGLLFIGFFTVVGASMLSQKDSDNFMPAIMGGMVTFLLAARIFAKSYHNGWEQLSREASSSLQASATSV